MTRGLLLIGRGVVETQLEYAYHRLREDAVLIDVASLEGGPVEGDRGGTWETTALADVDPARRYDLLVVPAGEGTESLAAEDETARFLEAHLETGGIVCAIGDGVGPLAAMGAVAGRMVTGFDGGEDDLEAAGAIVTREAVTIDGTLVTVRDTDAIPYGIAAALGSVAIPQDRASRAIERPRWERSDA